ncbi:acyl carrier protein [Streptacidiphilus sp. MAP12-33]|uniref:acyl carrier protein n=1 Tax=Streptacidiphilus sp. MAP12-33 TaxID=3156266 RepID=UPI003512FDD2
MATLTTSDDYVNLLRDLVGFPVSPDELDTPFDMLNGWDSVHLLKLVTAIERESGVRLAVARVLEAQTLNEIFGLASLA